jgi:hypothetical protein
MTTPPITGSQPLEERVRAKSLDQQKSKKFYHPLTRSYSNMEGVLRIAEGQLADIEALTKTIQALYEKFSEEHN